MKPQKVRKWATPGTDHFSSFRWPSTSASSARSRDGTPAIRPGAGCPVRTSRDSHHTRRPAIANAATVNSNPRTSRTVNGPSSTHEDAHSTGE